MSHTIEDPRVQPYDAGPLPLEQYMQIYLNAHTSCHLAGPTYLNFYDPLHKYLLPILGTKQMTELSPDVLRECYMHMHKFDQLPIGTITGIHRFLEVAIDYMFNIGMLKSNLAAMLTAEYIRKNHFSLHFTEYPATITYSYPPMVGYDRTDVFHVSISIPNFPDIYYGGYDPQDGLNLVRRCLLDEILANPHAHAPIAISKLDPHLWDEIVLIKLNV